VGITVGVDNATHGATAVVATSHRENDANARPEGRLKRTWPLHSRQVRDLVAWGVVITAVFAAIGWLLTRPLEDSALMRYDEEVAERLVENRTPTWNTLSWWGSMLAETAPKIVVTSIIAIVFVRIWKRWLEAVVVATALVLEASCFLAITLIVGRPRPEVEQLDSSPIGSSFPSGHTAAAVVYGTLAVIVFWHTRKVIARVSILVLCTLVALAVGLARMYRGMHHLTDTVAGAVLGIVCLVVTVRVVRSSQEARDVLEDRDAPAGRETLDDRALPARSRT
jgi:undecaprenyl-diphosphatase